MRQFLVAPKDKSEKKDITGPIYSIHCQGQTNRGQCEEFYIGKTERSLKARFLEHRRPSSTSSEVSQYIRIESPGHKIDLEKVKILDREPRWFERGVKEAIYIRINQPTLNKDGGGAIQVTKCLWPSSDVTTKGQQLAGIGSFCWWKLQ